MDSREHHVFILASSILPLIGFVAAVVLLWNSAVGVSDLVAFGVMYFTVGIGVTVGYHRLFAHRSFKTSRPMKIFFAVAGSMAAQAPPLIWTSHHRRHHRMSDKPGDPHSPYHNDEPGIKGLLKGLWHAHMGWLFDTELQADPMRYCPDLARDKDIRRISSQFMPLVLAGLLLPGLIGLAIGGTALSFATGVLWGGLGRIFVTNHMTYAINSICHVFGRRRFAVADESRNVAWLALPTFGESWHNNHHAFPRSYTHGMRWYEVDISALTIGLLERLRLVSDVVRVDRETMDRRAATLARAGTGGRHAEAAPSKPLSERRELTGAGVTDVE